MDMGVRPVCGPRLLYLRAESEEVQVVFMFACDKSFPKTDNNVVSIGQN